MSTQSVSALIQQYNKNTPYGKRLRGVPTSTGVKLGTASYANKYDILYQKYSQDENFNLRMWRDAIESGDQDQYLTFLEQNKGRRLSDEFYDPQYYDYETMMLEMYLPLADTEKTEKYTQDYFDAERGAWRTNDLGEMTQRQYYEYLLSNSRATRAQDIQHEIEQWNKEQLGGWQYLHDVGATLGELGEGILTTLTGVFDVVGGLGYASYAGVFDNQNWGDAFVNYFGELGLTAQEKRTLRVALDEYERLNTHFRDIDGNVTDVGKYAVGISNSIGMMVPSIILSMATGGTSNALLSCLPSTIFYSAIFAGNMHENATNIDIASSPSWFKILNAGVKTGAEYVIEFTLGKLLGGTIQNKLLGIGGKTLRSGFTGAFGKTAGIRYLFKSAAQEGLEEFLQDFGTMCIDQFSALCYEGYGKDGINFQTLIDSFCIGFLSSIVMSGGQIGLSAAKSGVTNWSAQRLDKKDGGNRYDTTLKAGPGDILIETEKGPQKVRSLNKLYFSEILSQFDESIKELKKGKLSDKKNVKLAREIYHAMSALTRFYSSFSPERIANCETLLSRVINAEEISKADGSTLTSAELADTIETTFRSMVYGVSARHATRVAAQQVEAIARAARESQEQLAEAGVTTVTGAVDTNGVQYQRDPLIGEVAERLGKKAAHNLDELRRGYEWVITTDGHAAVESDGYLFVSEAWLQNYGISEIYKYLEQTRILETLASDKTLAPMVRKLIAFDKEFTGQTDVNAERALMDLLFNKSVYQAFLLSNAGKNMHEFKAFIFQLHEIVKELGQRSKYHQQLFKGKQAQKRINMLNQIYALIKETMREPTIKAILNWHIDPQVVGADSVLTARDRQVINQYEQRHRILNGTGTDHSAYKNLAEDIIANANFNDEQLALIRKSLDGTATIDEDIEARALLDEADMRMTMYDFEVSPDYSYYLASVDKIVERLKSIDFTKIPESHSDEKRQTILSLVKDIDWYVQEAIDDAPGYMDSRNLGTEAGIVKRAVERIRETLEEYNYDTSKNSDIDFLVDNLGDDGSLETLEEDMAELTRLLKASLDTTDETPYDVAVTQLTEIINDIESHVNKIRHRTDIPEKLRDRINFWYERSFESDLINRGAGVDLNLIAMSGVQLIRDYCAYVEKNTIKHRKKVGLGAFTIPYQAAAIAMNEGDIAGAQFVTDKLDEFKNIYGISARQMIIGDLSGMSMVQRNQLTQDMELLDVENITLFVIKKLEGMLGGKYIVTPTTFAELALTPEDFERLRNELQSTRDRVNEWIVQQEKDIHRINNEDTAFLLVHDFYDMTEIIRYTLYSEFVEYLPDVKDFWKEFDKIWRVDGSVAALRHIISVRTVVDNLFESLNANLIKTPIQTAPVYDDTHVFSNVYDFVIAKAIPAETFLSHDILTEDVETRNAIFERMFKAPPTPEYLFKQIFDRVSEYNSHYDELTDLMKERFSREEINSIREEMEAYPIRVEMGEDPDVIYGEFIESIQKGLNPFTGEFFYDEPTDTIDDLPSAELFGLNLIRDAVPYVPLSKFIDISKFPDIVLDDVKIYLEDAGKGNAGYTLGNTIVIDPVQDSDHFGTLIHEINHLLQERYNMPHGFNPGLAYAMPDFLAYVVNHYPNYIKYMLYRTGYSNDIEIIYGKDGDARIMEESFLKMPIHLHNIISHCSYMLVQGELWGRAHMHNGKPVHGFVTISDRDKTYILAPDGKTKFKVASDSSDTLSMNKTSYTSDMVAGSALDVAIQKLFLLKGQQERGGYAATSRNTYHSHFTKSSSLAMTRQILSPDAPPMAKYTVKLGDIIRDPQSYLAPEILAMCNGDFSEGNVFYRIKEYVEAKVDGVSIDITDGLNPQYVWVDDNAFDDLLLVSMKSKVESQKSTLATKYKAGEHIPLTEFYLAKELARLGINPSAYIVISPDVATETVFDDEHRTGAIFIKADENTTDARIIDSLNHEFRHLLQRYNGFATGFTPNFKVSREMIADVKKHVPGLFKNDTIVRWAKALGGTKWEEALVQRFVYYTTSGELNAYAFNARDLYAKPTFVNKEAGHPVIFLPWYDAKTGEGRHQTEYLAMRADDTDVEDGEKPKKLKKRRADDDFDDVVGDTVIRPDADRGQYGKPPTVDKKPKAKERITRVLESGEEVVEKYIYKNNRFFSKKKAEGTNLMHFFKKGERNQMDPDLQEFVIATTGHEGELPKELVYAIQKGILTKQALLRWFRRVDTMNDFTFNLVNKYIFKNDYITSLQQLDAFIAKPERIFAAGIILRREGLSLDDFAKTNTTEEFLAIVDMIESYPKYQKDFAKYQALFLSVPVLQENGSYERTPVVQSEKLSHHARVTMMRYFTSSLASAFYAIENIRSVLGKYETETLFSTDSLDAKASMDDDDGDDGYNIVTEENQLSVISSVGNDIIELYESEVERSADDMISQIGLWYLEHLCEQYKIADIQKASDKKKTIIAEKVAEYTEKLRRWSMEGLRKQYMKLQARYTTGVSVTEETFMLGEKEIKQKRQNVQNAIKRRADKLLEFIRDGKIAFEELPKEVQDMFELVEVETSTKKKAKVYQLKPSVYMVGRGRVRIQREDDKHRIDYAAKRGLNEDTSYFRHDITTIMQNLQTLHQTVEACKELIKVRINPRKKSDVERVTTRAERSAEHLSEALSRAHLSSKPKEGELEHRREFRTAKRKKRTVDTPTVFNITSGIEMPDILFKILDTSFEDMADTEVQFASRAEDGTLYDKEHFTEKEFHSRVQHEVSSWDAFYEANRDTLLSLTRNDVLSIIEFFSKGTLTIDGPANKLAAFEIFLLGYFVDGSRRNFNNWDFSDSERDLIERLYEQKASTHGSGLRAVRQMLSTVDPMKKIRQRMFQDWTAISDADKDALCNLVDDMQTDTNAETRREKALQVVAMLEDFGKRQTAADKSAAPRWSKAWWSRLGKKVKSWRYMAMLSGPTTWIRNSVSNVLLTAFNGTADFLGKSVKIAKKGYTEGQWDLAGVKISDAAKTFIDVYILQNPVFDSLYEISGKYDSREKKKRRDDERSLLISLIARAYEQQYNREHRFDSAVMRMISKFIDSRISDAKFVKRAVRKYFGKILTIEVARGNVDLSKGFSEEAMNLFAEAVILANEDYMHKRSFVADWLDSLRESSPKLYEALTFWQPFLNSSFNWFTEFFKYNPLGLAASITRLCRLEKEIAKLDERRAKGELVRSSRATEYLIRRDIGKGMVGLLLSGLGLWLALAGRLRIDEEDDKFYLFIDGDIKVDISDLFASSSLLIGAAVAQRWIEQSDGDTAGWEEVIIMSTNVMLDGFFAVDILERHRWGNGWTDILTETESVMRSFVPQAWQTIVACTNNQDIRYSPGILGMIERWSNTFIPGMPLGNRKVNPYTGQIESVYALPILDGPIETVIGALLKKGIALGTNVYWTEIDDVERLCREYGVNKNELTGEITVNGKKQYLDRMTLNQKYGELNKESLSKVKSQRHEVEMPDGTYKTLSWDKMSDLQRSRVLARTMTDNADIAKIYVWTQINGKKYYASSSDYAELRKLGITRNVYLGDKGFVE